MIDAVNMVISVISRIVELQNDLNFYRYTGVRRPPCVDWFVIRLEYEAEPDDDAYGKDVYEA